jgi:hypothetical protein
MDLSNYIRTFSHAIQVVIAGILLALGLGVKSMLIGSFASCAIIHALTVMCIGKIIHLHIWDTEILMASTLKGSFIWRHNIYWFADQYAFQPI